jgi:hypothetical protein
VSVLRKTFLVLALSLASIGNSLAQFQGPAPFGELRQPEPVQAQSPEQPVPADPRGTEQSPLIVKVLPTDNPGEPPQEHGSAIDWLLAILILLLVLVGAGQGIVFAIQAKRLRETVQSLMSGESAVIHLTELDASLLLPSSAYADEPESPGVPLPAIACEFLNIGRTTAIIKEIRGELFLGAQFPAEPAYAYSKVRRGEIVARPEKNTVEQLFEYNRNFTQVEIELIKERKANVLFFGYIKYSDVFSRLHTKGFGFMCRGPNKFQVWGGRAYNYVRSEKELEQYTI